MPSHPPISPADADVPDEVVERIESRRTAASSHLEAAVSRREAAFHELSRSQDPEDQLVAGVYRDFLIQVDEARRSGAAMLLGADPSGTTIVGRIAVFDHDRDLLIVPWHAPEGQRCITARDRLLITEQGDGPLAVHRLTADAHALADRIRHSMRTAARREAMSDPLATLTTEQGDALERIGRAEANVLLTGPPGSGKSAIVLVELARQVLSHPDPHALRVLFVTGTPRLAQRAEALGRLLGVASITPVPQASLPRLLDLGDGPAPIAGAHPGADGADVPHRIETRFTELQAQLEAVESIPHPLGSVEPAQVAAVRGWQARATSTPYTKVAQGLRRDLLDEYERILPGHRSITAAETAADLLRPKVSPSDLVKQAMPDRSLPMALRRAATACARSLLETAPTGGATRWDLVVVDEYQRLPGTLLWLLRRAARRLLLSGDPHQSFTDEDVRGSFPATAVSLATSLRLPSTIGSWLDTYWHERGLPSPGIRSAAPGGTVRTVSGAAAHPSDGAQVIGPASLTTDREGWLDPLDALGLEWPEVVLLAPERILTEHGPAGLFVAATRAIDVLTIDPHDG
jgi:hypothetical protein